VLVTSGTLTSATLLARRLPEGVIHQFAPVDAPGAVAAFLDHWRPSSAVFVESELWPNLILDARARRETGAGQRPDHGEDRRGLAALPRRGARDPVGLRPHPAAGRDLRRPAGKPRRPHRRPCEPQAGGRGAAARPAAFTKLSAAIGDRPVVVAASTHDGEEIAIVRALDKLADRLCLILVPRHPDRSAAIAAALTRDGYRFALRSQGGEPDRDTDLYVADTLGEMGLFLRLADVVVMGGSFSAALEKPPVGGHNPLEPARLGKPAVTGPDMTTGRPSPRRWSTPAACHRRGALGPARRARAPAGG
jgi:3-deoxy-D-manno-octulosonic-acid transferase